MRRLLQHGMLYMADVLHADRISECRTHSDRVCAGLGTGQSIGWAECDVITRKRRSRAECGRFDGASPGKNAILDEHDAGLEGSDTDLQYNAGNAEGCQHTTI